jgi:hypothetical protein
MAAQARIVETPQGWFVATATENFGPMESEREATRYLYLMLQADAARTEIACTEAECL